MLPKTKDDDIAQQKRMIYINPHFQQLKQKNVVKTSQATHINPLFLSAHTIHMNPEFLEKHIEECQTQHKLDNIRTQQSILGRSTTASTNKTTPSSSKTVEYSKLPTTIVPHISNNCSKIIIKSRTRLVREPLVKRTSHKEGNSLPPLISLNKRKLVRCTPQKTTRAHSKKITLKFVSGISQTNKHRKVNISLGTPKTYKLDNRNVSSFGISTVFPLPKTRYRRPFVAKYALRRATCSEGKKMSYSRKTLYLNPANKNKKIELLNINGVLYKSTRNKLQRKDVLSNKTEIKTTTINKQSTSPQLARASGLIIAGTKYIMDPQGFKLTCLTPIDAANVKANTNSVAIKPRQRIDIGGLTYVASETKNVFVRTQNHITLAHVNSAKQRSVQQLRRRYFKINIPCAIFQRVGRCVAFERGKCTKKHDKQQVIVCPKFLRGECLDEKCLLSHVASYSKMPVCKFFLQGTCVREKCPYLHKKLSPKTEICDNFLRGFCQLAEQCKKRHEFICPEFERVGKCKTQDCDKCKIRLTWRPKDNEKQQTEPLKEQMKIKLSYPRKIERCNNIKERKVIEIDDDHHDDIPQGSRYFSKDLKKESIQSSSTNKIKKNRYESNKIDSTDEKFSSENLNFDALPNFIPI